MTTNENDDDDDDDDGDGDDDDDDDDGDGDGDDDDDDHFWILLSGKPLISINIQEFRSKLWRKPCSKSVHRSSSRLASHTYSQVASVEPKTQEIRSLLFFVWLCLAHG